MTLPHLCTSVACSCECVRASDAENRLVHASGLKASHTRTRIRMCKECSFQAGSIHCHRCAKAFCDSCFQNKHRVHSDAVAADMADVVRPAHRWGRGIVPGTTRRDAADKATGAADAVNDRVALRRDAGHDALTGGVAVSADDRDGDNVPAAANGRQVTVRKKGQGYNVVVRWGDHKTERILQECAECGTFTARYLCQTYVVARTFALLRCRAVIGAHAHTGEQVSRSVLSHVLPEATQGTKQLLSRAGVPRLQHGAAAPAATGH
jgi:hypothetical protein